MSVEQILAYLQNFASGMIVLALVQSVLAGVFLLLQPFFLLLALRFSFWLWRRLHIEEARDAIATERPPKAPITNWMRRGESQPKVDDGEHTAAILRSAIERRRARWRIGLWAVYVGAGGVTLVTALFIFQQPYAALAGAIAMALILVILVAAALVG